MVNSFLSLTIKYQLINIKLLKQDVANSLIQQQDGHIIGRALFS